MPQKQGLKVCTKFLAADQLTATLQELHTKEDWAVLFENA
jgi:hypothetical protein